MDERRFFTVLRAESLNGRTFVGRAAAFDVMARIGGHWESINRAAFNSALARQDDVQMTFNHEPSRLLARTSSGTLRLAVDGDGLAVEADLPDTSDGRDVMVLLERGDLHSMSFMGLVNPGSGDRWDVAPDGRQRNEILDFERLVDVAVVTRPAYSGTDAILRSVEWANLPRVNGREQIIRARAARLTRKEA